MFDHDIEGIRTPDEYDTPLGRAIAHWHRGEPISFTLAATLMAEGYDVGALEAAHMA